MHNIPSRRSQAQLTDFEREILIALFCHLFTTSSDPNLTAAAWKMMRELIFCRSARAITAMEKARGLYKTGTANSAVKGTDKYTSTDEAV